MTAPRNNIIGLFAAFAITAWLPLTPTYPRLFQGSDWDIDESAASKGGADPRRHYMIISTRGPTVPTPAQTPAPTSRA